MARGRAAQRLEGAFDELLAALDEHLDGHVVGDQCPVDDLPLEVVVGLGGRGEPDLDLLEPDVDQRAEEPQLALRVHRIDQRLVPVAQVHAGPARGDSTGGSARSGRAARGERRDGRGGRASGETSQGMARRGRSPVPPTVGCSWSLTVLSFAVFLLLLLLVVLVLVTVLVGPGPSGVAADADRRPPNKKPPGPEAQEVAGERRCGVRRQVRRRSEVVTV